MTRIILFVFFLTITLSGFGQSASKFFKAGDTFMSNSMYEDAVEQFTNAIEMNPNDTKGYIMRAEAFQKAGRPEEAYDDIEKARIFDPKNPEILLLCGRICNDMGRYEEALDHLDYATSIAKREETLYPEKVRTLNALGQYDLALKVSDTALLFKEDALNYYQRGLAFEGLLNDIRAQADYEKAVRKNKKYEPARLALGYLLIKDGNLDEAMEHAEYLISENDRDTDAYLLRSKIYSRQLNYPNAINDASRNILIEPDNPMHYATRGLYYQEFNQHANAINDFSKAIALDGSNAEVLFRRAYSYEQLMDLGKAAADYAKITVLLEFDPRAFKMLEETNKRLYEVNRESNSPEISLTNPVIAGDKVEIRGDSRKVIVSGNIKEKSELKSLVINGNESLYERGNDGLYEFLSNIDIEDVNRLNIEVTDVYDNVTRLDLEIKRTEITPPVVNIIAPYASDGQIMIERNQKTIAIQGKIMDESIIKSIFIDGVTASWPVDDFNPNFTAYVDILNKDKITVTAEDGYGNRQVSEFVLNREGAVLNAENPMGKTWVVFIENSNYETFASLDGPVKDVNLMKRALADYQVHYIITKKDLTKEQMEMFFSFELRDMIKANQVKSLLIWYSGHGKFVNETGYWIPVDASRDVEYTYFNTNFLRAAMQPYQDVLTHMLVVTDACESGPSFYAEMRGYKPDRSCDDWEATQSKSSQVLSSAGGDQVELATDDSQFTRSFANTLLNNPNACIPVDEIYNAVTLAVVNNSKQKPRFARINGLQDDGGTFFFIAK